MPEGCRLAVNSRGTWRKKQNVHWEAAGVVQDGAPWGDWVNGDSPADALSLPFIFSKFCTALVYN